MMSSLIRMVYASTSSRPIAPAGGSIPRDVGRVLMQSRRNNPAHQISGVLYFDNNYFLQCLEGEQVHVDELYRKILRDPRHKQVTTLTVKRINQRLFPNWSMKYVVLEQNMTPILREFGLAEFNPYQFNEAAIEAMLNSLAGANDVSDTASRQIQGKSVQSKGLLSRLFSRLRAA